MPILTAEERIGTSLAGKYRLEEIIGTGGVGIVFRATHTWTNRQAAVKLLRPEFATDQRVVRRFLREARTASMLQHPNIVEVLDMGETEDGAVYLALELLEGFPLSQLIGEGQRLSPQHALELMLPMMRALTLAHRRGFVHRDLKPDNIFISHDAEDRVVPKLLDFGIVKALDGSDATMATREGVIVGTPEFMSREQARGEPNIGPPTDVWAMGVVLYRCISGTLPFSGATTTQVLAKILTERPRPLSAVAPSIGMNLARCIDRCMSPRVEDRYPHMQDFLDEVVQAAGQDGVQIRNARRPGGSSPRVELTGRRVDDKGPWEDDTESAPDGMAHAPLSFSTGIPTLAAFQREPSDTFQTAPTTEARRGTYADSDTDIVKLSRGTLGGRGSRTTLVVGAAIAAAMGIIWAALAFGGGAPSRNDEARQPMLAAPPAEPVPPEEETDDEPTIAAEDEPAVAASAPNAAEAGAPPHAMDEGPQEAAAVPRANARERRREARRARRNSRAAPDASTMTRPPAPTMATEMSTPTRMGGAPPLQQW